MAEQQHEYTSCCSVAQLCLTLCSPVDYSTPGFPVLHCLPEFAQTHIHGVNDAIQPSHPLSSPSPPAFKLSQHQGLFQWVSSLHQVANVLELQLQHQSFQWIIQVWFPLGLTGLIPLQSKGLLGQVECLLQARLRQSLLRIEAGSHSFSGEKVTLWKCSLRAAFKKYHHLSEKLLTMFNFGAVALFCLSVLPVYLSVLPQAANSSTTKLCLFISPLLSTMPCV